MTDYDGSVRINTEIETKNIKKQINSIVEELKILEKQKKSLEQTGAESTPLYQNTVKEIQKAEESLGSLKKKLEDVQKEAERNSGSQNEHWNQLRIDVEEYTKSLKELQGQGKFFGDEEYDKVYLAWKNATDAVKAYQAELNKQTASGQARIADQEAKAAERKEAAERKAAEQAEKALQRENARIQKEIENEAKLQAKEAERQAKIQAEADEEERLNRIRVRAVAANDEIIAKVERIKQLEQEIADLKAAGVTEGYADYDNRIQELSELKQGVKEYRDSLSTVPEKFEKMRASAQKAFNAIRSGLSAIGNISKKVFSAITGGLNQNNVSLNVGLKTILKYGLGIRSLYALFNKIRAGIQAGFTNLMGYSDSFANSIQSVKNSMSTLGNQIVGAFRPVVEMVIPWLNSLISTLTTAMTYVAQFIAALGGSSTFTKAKKVQDSYNKSLGGTAKAADKARGALAKFDDLDVLHKQEDASAGGAGANSIFGDMFEEIPVESKWSNLADWFKEMWFDSDFYELGKMLGECLENALENIPWDEIKRTARRVGESISTLLNGFIEVKELGYSIGYTISQAINTGFEFLNASVHKLHWESVGHFISDTLNGFFETIDWRLIRDTFIRGFYGLADSINSFIGGFHWDNISETVSNAVNILSESIYALFSTVKWEELGKETGDQIAKSIKKIDWKKSGKRSEALCGQLWIS